MCDHVRRYLAQQTLNLLIRCAELCSNSSRLVDCARCSPQFRGEGEGERERDSVRKCHVWLSLLCMFVRPGSKEMVHEGFGGPSQSRMLPVAFDC